jgi:glutamate/tyrosine decarboxylase-like PLP-dependent enzyme
LQAHDADWLRHAGHAVMDEMLTDYLTLGEKRIGPVSTRDEMERLLREPPPEAGSDLQGVLADVRSNVLGRSFRVNHPRFLAFIPGAPTFEAVLGDCLAANANLFAGVWKEAAGAAQVEIVVLDWFKQFLGYPAEAAGLLTSGGSDANLTALVVARDRLSYDDRARAILYASEHRHWSVDRAAKIVGLRPDQIRPLPCDTDYRLRLDSLREAIAQDERHGRLPWLVLANAGTTNTGSVDPLPELADLCAARLLWLHVDAAYGWAMSLTDEGKALLAGIDRADSITLDPHKWFAQPFEAGGLLVRNGPLLAQTFMMRPEYMQDVVPRSDEINFCDHGIALTRRFRALKVWLSMKLLGLTWFRRLIEHSCALAAYAQALIENAGCFEITSARKMSIVCFRYRGSDALQLAIADELTRDNRAFISTTQLNGRNTLRFCFVNWRTSADDVEMLVQWIATIGRRLSEREA